MGTREFSRYREIVTSLARPALQAASQSVATPDSILLGVPAALLLLEESPPLQVALLVGLRHLAAMGRQTGPSHTVPALRDSGGHTRPIYHLLVLHLHLAAYRRRYESLPPQIWSGCEDALADALLPVRQVESFADQSPLSELTDLVLWQALCLLDHARLAQRDTDAELVDAIVHATLSRPGPDGALHPRDAAESLDGWTYRELCGLHALANLALARRNAAWSARVEQIALHHLENTQPDNTTTQPWGVFAFLWSPKTRSFAEQQLHDASTQSAVAGHNSGSVTAILLADAADSLATFAE